MDDVASGTLVADVVVDAPRGVILAVGPSVAGVEVDGPAVASSDEQLDTPAVSVTIAVNNARLILKGERFVLMRAHLGASHAHPRP